VTLKHLLSFSSGYDWNEHVYGFGDSRDSHNQMFTSQDPVEYLLARAMTGTPGAAFHYNSGDTNLIGEVVRRQSPSPTLVQFAREYLFAPLEIDTFAWSGFSLAPGMTFASGGASLRPRDMAKLGQLYLDGGMWRGIQVVSPAWVEASTRMAIPLIDYGALTGYGYNWWLGSSAFRGRRSEFFLAAGWGGQYVFSYPELDLVVVFTAGGFYEERPLSVSNLIEDFILEAVM
jgi:CubicO group peptidase (beta-lactamase class C family)